MKQVQQQWCGFSVRMLGALALLLALGAGVLSPALPAAAQPAPSNNGWQPGPDATGDNAYVGFVDSPTANGSYPTNVTLGVDGWIVDTSAQGWSGIDQVQVWLGTMGNGGTMLAQATYPVQRPDVGDFFGYPYWAASGFSASILGGTVTAGTATLNVYAHSQSKGWWYKPVTFTVAAASYTHDPVVAITAPTSGETIKTSTSEYQISGYAFDRNANLENSSGVDRVQVYLGGDRSSGTYLGDATLEYGSSQATDQYGPQFNGTGWVLPFEPTKFHAGDYQLYAYAHSAVTGVETVTTMNFTIVEQ